MTTYQLKHHLTTTYGDEAWCVHKISVAVDVILNSLLQSVWSIVCLGKVGSCFHLELAECHLSCTERFLNTTAQKGTSPVHNCSGK